jgi:HSP20 family protein
MRNPISLWSRENPLSDWTSFQSDLDRFFDQKWFGRLQNSELGKDWNPRAAITEDEKAYHVKVDLPGVQKDQIKLDFHENTLTISGERHEEKKSDSEKQHYSEVFTGSFTRRFAFPVGVDEENVVAKHENGVLTVELAKSTKGKPRQITVR